MDYKKTLKKRLYLSVGYIIIGVIMLVVGSVLDTKSLLVGYGGGLIGCGIVFARNYLKALKDDEKAKMLQIQETDERNIMISNKAKSMASLVYIVLLGIASIVFAIMEMPQIVMALSLAVCLYIVIYTVFYYIYQKKN